MDNILLPPSESDSSIHASHTTQNLTEHYPTGRWGHSLCMIGEDEVLLIGGQAEKKIKDNIWLLDLENASWIIPEISANGLRSEVRMGHTAVYYQQLRNLYLFGGYRNSQCLNELHILDIDEMKWKASECTETVPCRAYHSANLYKDEMFIFGGQSSSKKSATIVCLNDVQRYLTLEDSWVVPQISGKPPAPRSGHSCSLLTDKLVIFGGWNGSRYFNDIHILDLNLMKWFCVKLKGTQISPRSWHASATLWSNRVLIHGGWDGMNPLEDIHILNFDMMICTRIILEPSLPARLGHVALCLPFSHENKNKDQVLMVGGGNNSNKFFQNLINIMIPTHN